VICAAFDPYDGFEYSGSLRACYPKAAVPKRVVPEHIGLPDYATASEYIRNIPNKWSTVWGGSVWAKADEVASVITQGLKEVG